MDDSACARLRVKGVQGWHTSISLTREKSKCGENIPLRRAFSSNGGEGVLECEWDVH